MSVPRRTRLAASLALLAALCLLGQVPAAANGFGKTSPADGATGVALTPTLSWGTVAGALWYAYCYDTTDNDACDPISWIGTDTATSVVLTGLAPNTTYYWQVFASTASGIVYADGGTWLSFTTGNASFGKVGPANGATGQSLTPTLSWGSAAGATQYVYCIDTSNDNVCAGNWISTGTTTSAVLHGLLPNTSYYWQVEANVGGVWVQADPGAWWSFTTAPWSKLNPTSGSTGVPLNPTLSWQPAPGSDSYTYAYCIDTSNDNTCAGNWMSTGTSTSANPAGLLPSTRYYWQAYYSDSGYGTRYANDGTWWTFTTGAHGVPNDDFGSATVIGSAPFTTTQDVAAATTAGDDPLLPCPSAGQRSRSVWYRYTPPGAQTVTVDTLDSDYDTVLGVWTGSRGSLTSVACNDDDPGVLQSRVEFAGAAGTTYYIEVAAFWDSATTSQLTLNLEVAGPVPVTATFKSVAAYDGWVLESSETSGVGGSLNSTATTCRVGDDAWDRQYRSILDFNTGSLPNDAVITGVALRIKSSSVVGTSPFGTHGNLIADIRRGAFSGNLALESADFQAVASKSSAGTFGTVPVSGWYRSDLLASAYSKVNLKGHTQVRLRFATDDNNDAGADYLAFLCGNAAAASRPQLIVTYYVP